MNEANLPPVFFGPLFLYHEEPDPNPYSIQGT